MKKFVELNEQEKLETTGGFIATSIALGTGFAVGAVKMYNFLKNTNKIKD